MDPGDTTSMLFTKIRALEPENGSKIIGYLLLQDLGKRDLMRLALGSDSLLQSLCLKAKSDLGLSSETLSTSTSLNPISRPINIHRHSFSQSSPRVFGNGFAEFSRSPSSSSPTLNTNHIQSSSPFRNGLSLLGSSSVTDGVGDASRSCDFLDEQQLGDYFSFLNDSSPESNEVSDPFGFSSNYSDAHFHQRSFSASDVFHGRYGDSFGGHGVIGSPSKLDYVYQQQKELMRVKIAHQQRMATAQFIATGVSPYDKSHNSHSHLQDAHRLRPGPGPRHFEKEGYWYGSPDGYEREEDLIGDRFNAASRQIYLTFPAESCFTDEDVSSYFSNYGAVLDVRIPYQQRRMFGIRDKISDSSYVRRQQSIQSAGRR